MLKKGLAVAALGAAVALSSCQKKADETSQTKLTNNVDSVSYVIGANIGKSLKMSETDFKVNMDAIVKGISFGLNGKDSLLTEQQMMAIMQKFQAEQMAAMQKKADSQKQDGINFLAKNKTAPGVTTTASGLQYKVITEGKGATPKATDKVKVHYTGTTIDGKEFDSSVKRGEPVEFQVGGVIKGWVEALQLMKEGSKYQLFIPSELAYGEQGVPGIAPNSVLIFDVELLSIVK